MWLTDGRTLNHCVLKEMTASSCCPKKKRAQLIHWNKKLKDNNSTYWWFAPASAKKSKWGLVRWRTVRESGTCIQICLTIAPILALADEWSLTWMSVIMKNKVYGSTRAVRNHWRPCLASFSFTCVFLKPKGMTLGTRTTVMHRFYLGSVRLGAWLAPTLNVQSLKRRGWLSRSNPVMTITSVRPQSKSPFFVLLYFEYCAVGGSITSVIDYCLSAALFFFLQCSGEFLVCSYDVVKGFHMISYMMVISYVRLALADYYRSVRTSLSTIYPKLIHLLLNTLSG